MSRPNYRIKIESRKHSNTVLNIDNPKHSGDKAAGQTPLEYLFLYLAGYIGAIGRIVACQNNLPLRSIDARVTGALNMGDIMERYQNNWAGSPRILLKVRIDADMSPEEKKDFLQEVTERCFVAGGLQMLAEISIDPE